MISFVAAIASFTAVAPVPEAPATSRSPTYSLPMVEAPSARSASSYKGGIIRGFALSPNAQVGVGIFKSRVKDRDFPGAEVLGGPKARKRNTGVGLRFSF